MAETVDFPQYDYECRSCSLPISRRWKLWPKNDKQTVDLWEFLAECPACGDRVMIYSKVNERGDRRTGAIGEPLRKEEVN